MNRSKAGSQDEALAKARCSGSVDAFESAIPRHAPRIIRLAYHFLGDWDEARDLAQETMARAFVCLDRYDPSRPFEAWLCTIAARLAIDRLRCRRRLRAAKKALAATPRSTPDPDLTLSLREALDQLTRRQRQAVVLCDLHGFTAPEAARILGCSASTVRVQRFLARNRLRSVLGRSAPAAMGPLTPETRE